jgi:hypothetical protein
MKKNTILTLLLLIITIAPLTASKGWYWDYLILNVNNTTNNNYYWIGNKPKVYTKFDNTNLGIVDTLKIAGCDMRYWSDSKDRTGGSFFYKIMNKDGSAEVVPPVETRWTQTGPSENDYQGTRKLSIDLLSGLAYNTTYQLHVWAKSEGTDQGISWLNKPGSDPDYVMTFTKFNANAVKVYGANGIADGKGYRTLKAAFDAINNNPNQTGKNITITISGSTNETATATLNGNATPWKSLMIYPTESGVSVSGNLDAPLINLNGADNVTLDGRVNATGTARDLTIDNSNTGTFASTITFSQDAEQNKVNFCTLKGSSTGMNGTVYFFAESAANGNSFNTISDNLITNSGGNRPAFSLISGGSDTHPNKNNDIRNNEFKDFLSPTLESGAIYIQSYTGTDPTGWTITGNSFYETTTLTTTSDYYFMIMIGENESNTASTGYTISDNYIGGSGVKCSGKPWTMTSSLSNEFAAMVLNLKGTSAASVQNNTIQNISVTNSKLASLTGIYVVSGNVNIGTERGNTIGSENVEGSILLTVKDTVINSVQNSNINQVISKAPTFRRTMTYKLPFINMVDTTLSTVHKSNKSLINSMQIASTGNGTSSLSEFKRLIQSNMELDNQHYVYGIYNESSDSISVSNNIIAGLSNRTNSLSDSRWGKIFGINSLSGALTLTNNRIHDLTSPSIDRKRQDLATWGINAVNGSTKKITGNSIYNLTCTNYTEGFIVGIITMNGTGANIISNNNIYNLSAYEYSETPTMIGIYFHGGTGTNVVSGNFIHSLSSPLSNHSNLTGMRISTTDSKLPGINQSEGVVTCTNNIIDIRDSSRSYIVGIDANSYNQAIRTNIYFNTVCIGGTSLDYKSIYAGPYTDSHAIDCRAYNNCDIKNNIFSNVRSNAVGATGKHYAGWFFSYDSRDVIKINLSSNDYYAPGVGGVIGLYKESDVTSLPIVPGQDGGSVNADPLFANAGSEVASDYTIGRDLIGDTGLGVLTDYASNPRPSIPTMGALERNINRWKGNISSNWNDAGNWTANAVPAANANIIFDETPLRHCQLDQDRIVNDIVNASGTYQMQTNGHKLTINGDLNLTNDAKIDASSTNSTIEFAGTNSQVIPAGAFLNNNVQNLVINNPKNVSLSGRLNLLNTISATSGKLNAITNLPTIAYSGTSAQSIDSNPFLNNKVYDLLIDNPVEVSLSNDLTVDHLLTINAGKKLIIPTEKQLNVVGTITNNAGVDGLVIKASPTGEVPNGTLIFHNPQTPESYVPASVEMYTKSFYDPNGVGGYHYKWQFFGVPLRSLTASPTFDGSFVRENFETGTTNSEHWVSLENESVMRSFTGYEVTQESPQNLYFQGELENKDYNSGKLSYTPDALYPGQHLIGNPYTAAIDIDKIVFGSADSLIIDNTIYLYNTGTFSEWQALGDSGTINGTLPGQYTAIPKFNAGIGGLPSQIPSMQAFLVKVKSDNEAATISIPYSAASTMVKNTELQRVRKADLSQKVYTVIDVKGSRYTDKAWIFSNPTCSHGFDNGWDGKKVLTHSRTPQLFSMEKEGNYQVNTVDDINGTNLGFQAGEDTQYTLTFTHINTGLRYNSIYLIDLLENKTIDITQSGSTYSFVAQPTVTAVKRFKIITNGKNK